MKVAHRFQKSLFELGSIFADRLDTERLHPQLQFGVFPAKQFRFRVRDREAFGQRLLRFAVERDLFAQEIVSAKATFPAVTFVSRFQDWNLTKNYFLPPVQRPAPGTPKPMTAGY